MNQTKSKTLWGVLYTVVGGVCWGFSGTCGEYLFARYDVSALWLTCVRELGAGVLLLLAALLRRAPGVRGIWRARQDWVRLTLFSLGGLVLCQYSYMTAISYTNAGTTTVLQNLNLVFIMVLVCLGGRRWPTKKEAVAAALAVAGTFLLATHGNPGQMVLSREGLLWGLTTAVAVTLYTLLPSRIVAKWGSAVVMGWGMLLGGAFLALTTGVLWRERVDLTVGLALLLAAITVLGTVVAFGLFMQGVATIGPVRASMLATTEPVAATLLSFLWLGTTFAPMDLVGFACILATVFLLAGKETPPEEAVPEASPEAEEQAP